MEVTPQTVQNVIRTLARPESYCRTVLIEDIWSLQNPPPSFFWLAYRLPKGSRQYLSGHPRIHLIDPLDVAEMHNLMARSYLVMTDSGGLQEEAPALGR